MDLDDPGGDPVADHDDVMHAVLRAFDRAPASALFPGVDDIAAKAAMSPADLIRRAAVPASLTTDAGMHANLQFAAGLWKIIANIASIPEDNTPTLLAAIAEEHFESYAADARGIRRIVSFAAAAMAEDRPADDPDAAVENALRDEFRAAATRSYVDMSEMFGTLYDQLLEVWGRKARAPMDSRQIATMFTAIYEGLLIRYMCDDTLDLDGAKKLARFGIHAVMIAATAALDDDRTVEHVLMELLGTPKDVAVETSAENSAEETF